MPHHLAAKKAEENHISAVVKSW